MKKILLLCLIVCGFFNVAAQERYVKFVDEGRSDASLLAFRAKLIAAAKSRDAKFILSILDKNIKNSFGGNDGVAEFKDWWKIESPGSKFWDEFLPVITNGGKFHDSEVAASKTKLFVAPYTFQDFPDDLDAFTHSIIFGNNVNLRAKPEMNAPVVARLSYNVVEITNGIKDKTDPEKDDWYEIKTLGGKKGFVKAEFVRSPIDYRAGFEKKGGAWKMVFFIAGD